MVLLGRLLALVGLINPGVSRTGLEGAQLAERNYPVRQTFGRLAISLLVTTTTTTFGLCIIYGPILDSEWPCSCSHLPINGSKTSAFPSEPCLATSSLHQVTAVTGTSQLEQHRSCGYSSLYLFTHVDLEQVRGVFDMTRLLGHITFAGSANSASSCHPHFTACRCLSIHSINRSIHTLPGCYIQPQF